MKKCLCNNVFKFDFQIESLNQMCEVSHFFYLTNLTQYFL